MHGSSARSHGSLFRAHLLHRRPEEGRKFGIVDKYWKEIMNESIKDTHVIVVTAQDNMLGKLKELIKPTTGGDPERSQ